MENPFKKRDDFLKPVERAQRVDHCLKRIWVGPDGDRRQWTRQDLAEALGIQYQSLCKRLRQDDWKQKDIKEVAKILKVEPAFLVWRKATRDGGFRGTSRNPMHQVLEEPFGEVTYDEHGKDK